MKVGDKVTVRDDGLDQLAAISRKYGFQTDVPNNRGVVDEIKHGLAYVIFDDSGQCAPYAVEDCFVIEDKN